MPILVSTVMVTLETGDALPGGGGRTLTALAGEERGRAVIGPDGRLLDRMREGTLKGELVIRDLAQSSGRTFSQDYIYQSRIVLKEP